MKLHILFACVLLAITACGPATPTPALSERDLSQLICQPGDVPERLKQTGTSTQPPDETAEGLVNYYWVEFNDLQLTYQTFRCAISVYESVEAAERAIEAECEQRELASSAAVGEEACRSEPAGLVTILFRRGEAVVLIQADGDGAGINEAASAVDGRLNVETTRWVVSFILQFRFVRRL